MLPHYHALLSTALAVPFARDRQRLPLLATFVASSVLIDADHYLGYVLETGDPSFWNAYHFHRRQYRAPKGPPWTWRFRPRQPSLWFKRYRLFHALPLLAVLFTLSLRWRFVLPIALGFLAHRIQDDLWGSIDFHAHGEEPTGAAAGEPCSRAASADDLDSVETRP